MRRFLVLLTLSSLLILGLATSANAALSNDTTLSMTIAPSASNIKQGDKVTLSFRVTNVGQNVVQTHGVFIFGIPQELNVTNISFSYDTGFCVDPTKGGENFTSNYANHDIFFCYSSTQNYRLDDLAPKAFHSIEISANATAAFTDKKTQIFAFHHPAESEHDYSTYSDKINNLENIDPELIGTNNVVAYKYVKPVATSTTPSAQTQPQRESTQRTTAQRTPTENTTNKTVPSSDNTSGSSLITSPNLGDTSSQAEVAQDVRDRFPDRVVSNDTGVLSAVMSGNYKNQIAIFGSGILIAAIGFFVARKRYINRINAEKEYQKALKVRKIKFSATSNDDLSATKESVNG